MMCIGHLVEADLFVGENDSSIELQIKDGDADIIESEGTDAPVTVQGYVLEIHVPTTGISINFNLDEAKALIEAAQEIVDRYE